MYFKKCHKFIVKYSTVGITRIWVVHLLLFSHLLACVLSLVLINWSHTVCPHTCRTLVSCCAQYIANAHSTSNYSSFCFFVIVQRMVPCHIFKFCSEDRIFYFLLGFSVVLITTVSECFTNLNEYIFTTLLCTEKIIIILIWQRENWDRIN